MFQKDFWYAIDWAGDVACGILSCTVCLQRIILFRTEDRAAQAAE